MDIRMDIVSMQEYKGHSKGQHVLNKQKTQQKKSKK